MTRSNESEERGNSPASCLEQCTAGDRNSDRHSWEFILRSTICLNKICRKQLCNHWFIASLKCQTVKQACNLQVVNLGGPGPYLLWLEEDPCLFLASGQLAPRLVDPGQHGLNTGWSLFYFIVPQPIWLLDELNLDLIWSTTTQVWLQSLHWPWHWKSFGPTNVLSLMYNWSLKTNHVGTYLP